MDTVLYDLVAGREVSAHSGREVVGVEAQRLFKDANDMLDN